MKDKLHNWAPIHSQPMDLAQAKREGGEFKGLIVRHKSLTSARGVDDKIRSPIFDPPSPM